MGNLRAEVRDTVVATDASPQGGGACESVGAAFPFSGGSAGASVAFVQGDNRALGGWVRGAGLQVGFWPTVELFEAERQGASREVLWAHFAAKGRTLTADGAQARSRRHPQGRRGQEVAEDNKELRRLTSQLERSSLQPGFGLVEFEGGSTAVRWPRLLALISAGEVHRVQWGSSLLFVAAGQPGQARLI